MIVCLCHGISESKIREAIRTGAKSVNDIQKTCRAGTECGSCVMVLEEMVRKGNGPQHSANKASTHSRKDDSQSK